MHTKKKRLHKFQSFSLSEKYDSDKGFTEINGMYNDNGNKTLFSEIISEPPNSFDLNERLEEDFLSSPFDDMKKTSFLNDKDMIQLKNKKQRTNKKTHRKKKKNTRK
jgi:hypothetical protein